MISLEDLFGDSIRKMREQDKKFYPNQNGSPRLRLIWTPLCKPI